MRRWAVILGVFVSLLVGVGLGVFAVYALIPKAVLPLPKLPDTAPWYQALDIEMLAEKAAEAGGHQKQEPHLDSVGAIRQDGHVQYSASWTGPTDAKEVMNYLDHGVKSFVSSKGGRRLNSALQPLGPGGDYGRRLSWEFEVEGWTGWLHAWIVPGPENRFTLVITVHPVAVKWGK
jgi:hypothetical protein